MIIGYINYARVKFMKFSKKNLYAQIDHFTPILVPKLYNCLPRDLSDNNFENLGAMIGYRSLVKMIY